MKVTNNINSDFVFEGYNTVELAQRYGTPLYVVSEERIKARCAEIRKDFLEKYNNTKAAYASKAFLTMAMCKIIEREGLGLDVVSGGELYTAIKAEYPMDKVMFHGNNKSLDELELAVENNVGRIIVDNEYELSMLEEIAKKHNRVVKILFRVTPGVEGNTHKYITTGQKDSKFGIPLDKKVIENCVLKVKDSKNLELMGFHFHIGSQLFENDTHTLAIEVLMKLMSHLRVTLGFVTRELNTGGGFGIYYSKADNVKTLGYFTDAIMEAVYTHCENLRLEVPTIIIEPGRWVVGEAGITLYSVGTVKEIPDTRVYVSVDGGLPDNPRPALYKAKYDAIVANKANLEADRTVTIAGKCCESGDILIWDLEVPEVETGDILAVMSTGAYNYSMASNYNRLPRPPVVLLTEQGPELIVKRETYDDLLSRELIPNLLQRIEYLSQSAITKL